MEISKVIKSFLIGAILVSVLPCGNTIKAAGDSDSEGPKRIVVDLNINPRKPVEDFDIDPEVVMMVVAFLGGAFCLSVVGVVLSEAIDQWRSKGSINPRKLLEDLDPDGTMTVVTALGGAVCLFGLGEAIDTWWFKPKPKPKSKAKSKAKPKLWGPEIPERFCRDRVKALVEILEGFRCDGDYENLKNSTRQLRNRDGHLYPYRSSADSYFSRYKYYDYPVVWLEELSVLAGRNLPAGDPVRQRLDEALVYLRRTHAFQDDRAVYDICVKKKKSYL